MKLLLLRELCEKQRFWNKSGVSKYTIFSEDGLPYDLWTVCKGIAKASKGYYERRIFYWWMEFRI